MKQKHKKKKVSVLGYALVFWLALVLAGLAFTHVAAAQAVVHCSALAAQAEQFDTFFMTENERIMCDRVGIAVNVRFAEEMVRAREAQLAEDAMNNVVPFPATPTVPDWYTAQQNGRERDSAYLNLRPELQRICACESAGNPDAIPQHYERDGSTVLTGRVTPDDIGMCQISLRYHARVSKAMGLDVYDPHDNVAYANWLYKNLGSSPWKASRGCWDRD